MRNKLLVVIFTCFLLMAFVTTSCKTGVVASQHGLDDVAYIALASSSTYANKVVTVVVDNDTRFDAKVTKAKQNQEKRKGDLYGIKTGKRHVQVYYKGQVVFEKDIFVTSQQTKEIIL